MAININPEFTGYGDAKGPFGVTVRGRNKDNLSTVNFTRKQYEYLNKVFAEKIGTAATTEAELRINQGVRLVVCHVKELVRD